VPSFTRRVGAWLASDARLRRPSRKLEKELDGSEYPQ
jgi:hypothetical protein